LEGGSWEEVIAHLIQSNYQGDLAFALHATLPKLKGVFALAVIHKDHPDQILAAARDCPLSIAFDDRRSEAILSSDPNAFIGASLNVLFLKGDEIARLKQGSVEIYGKKLERIEKTPERLTSSHEPPSKEGFSHYLLKEIYEQPRTLQKALLGRTSRLAILSDELSLGKEELLSFENGWILGCGTSFHAGWIASLYLEELARFSAPPEIASEARCRAPLLSERSLILALSQSGETADTLAALRLVKGLGAKVLGFCNVKNSTLVREADATLFLKAGPEISVCSTKAFTSQLALLYLFSLHMASARKTLSPEAIQSHLDALQKLPEQIGLLLEKAPLLEKIAEQYAAYANFFFLGRHYMYPTCLEAALKLKEISYVHANGYAGGELKHGPIALLDANFPVVAFCANQRTEEKILSNLMEVKARGAPLFAIAPERLKEVESIADHVFWVPEQIDPLAPFLSTVVGQLFAYYIARIRGCDIDQPRNLAKSVTVE